MAINVYSGLMGSGKSYEAVSSLIIPAIASGRRIVTNIDGLSESAIYEYILAHKNKFKKREEITPESLGSIELVSNERVLEPFFFPDADANSNIVSVVQPGDFVVIDEAWRFWDTKAKPSHEHKQFFKMHRHYANPETGVTCDLALIIQDISGLYLDLKKVVEMTVRTTKLKSVGLNSRYRVDLYEGYRLTRTAKIHSYQKSYDKKIFPLYKSYAVEGAKETAIDSRQNIFKSWKIWFLYGVLPILFFSTGGWFIYNFFSTDNNKVKDSLSEVENIVLDKHSPVSPMQFQTDAAPVLSSIWRIAGTATIAGQPYVVLRDSEGMRIRYEDYSNFSSGGVLMSGLVDGQVVTTYSGTVEVSK